MLQKIKSQPVFSVCTVLSIVVFMGSIIFQTTANAAFAAEPSSSSKQFVTQVLGSGKPVIMIPGLMSDGRVWGKLANVLSTS
jgi:N-formylmaleamate deformylase